MYSDRELLELAAKAAGRDVIWKRGMHRSEPHEGLFDRGTGCVTSWNPLTDDGDALRLAVKLLIDVEHDDVCGKRFVYVRSLVAGRDPVGLSEIFDDENMRLEVTRRAIVRAAAAIGEAMQ